MITKDEALRYDKTALEANIKRLKDQIAMFDGEKAKLETEINHLYQIIAVIDAQKN